MALPYTFTAGNTIVSDQVDANFAVCLLTQTAGTVTVTHTFTPTQTFTGGWTAAAACTITSASASAFAVGLTGATNSAFLVDASTASQVAGLKLTGAATGGTVALVVTDSGADANLTVNAKGSGTIGIGSVSTGRVTITPVTTITGSLTLSAALIYGGVTLSNAVTGTGNMVLSASPTFTGTITAAAVTMAGALGGVTTFACSGAITNTATAASSFSGNGNAIIIAQGTGDGEILTLRSSDVAHGMTGITDTSTYGRFLKPQATIGGLQIDGLTDTDDTTGGYAIMLRAITGIAADTTKTTAAVGALVVRANIKDGTAATVVGANGNLMVIQNSTTAAFIFDAEGSAHADVEWIAF